MRVTVHHFKVWNTAKQDWEFPPSKRTAEGIIELAGQIIPGTAEEIEWTQLDGQGRYFPSGAALSLPPRNSKSLRTDPTFVKNENLDEVLENTFVSHSLCRRNYLLGESVAESRRTANPSRRTHHDADLAPTPIDVGASTMFTFRLFT